MPVRFFVTEGTVSDCRVASQLISGIKCDYVLADKGYDTNEIVEQIREMKAIPVIPPKSNRIAKRDYDQHIYKQRHHVENAFMHLKRWRGIATRYAKKLSSFIACVQIACIHRWLEIL